MKKLTIKTMAYIIFGLSTLCLLMAACKKDNGSSPTTVNPNPHYVNPTLVGKWMWTETGDEAYYDNNGVYSGSARGYATQYTIGADGYGTCFTHLFSTIGGATGFEVNISSQGFFESDDQGHLGYFPTSGTYKTSNGTNRALAGDELFDQKTGTGKSFLFQKLVVTTQGGRACFQVTSSDNIVDTYFKL